MAILTTHVGSLPRSQEVTAFLFAREHGEPRDPAAFDACMKAAVAEAVRRQVAAGIDIVSDGETSKISYATYVKDRYTGFAGDSPRNVPADLRKSLNRTSSSSSSSPSAIGQAACRSPIGTVSSNSTTSLRAR